MNDAIVVNLYQLWDNMTLNWLGGSTVQCDTCLWDDMTHNSLDGRTPQCDMLL